MGLAAKLWERLRGGNLKSFAESGGRLVHWVREDDNSWSQAAPRPFLLFLLLFGVAMVAISLFGDQGLFAYRTLAAQARQLRIEVDALEIQEQALSRQINALRSDPAAIERLARLRLGLVRPGEIVIELPASTEPE
jgi:cell division protein FtsB